MAIPAGGWLALPRLKGERLQQRSDKEKGTGSGVERKAFSGKCQPAFGVGLSIR